MKRIIAREIMEDGDLSANKLHPLLQRIYLARGINKVNKLERELKHLLPYDNLLGIDTAVTRLVTALQQQQHILIIGDFDVDGATSTALAIKALKTFGFERVSHLVPNRFEHGYGLTSEIVMAAAPQNPDLIITVDNGIAGCDGVKTAAQLGIEVLITDHHLAAAELPKAIAIVNPNQPQDNFPSKNLAGVGVIFYLMLALRQALRKLDWFNKQNIPEPNMANLLDLVALGTVADVVNLDKNNRILVHQGLRRIKSGKCCTGIKALLEIAGRNYQQITANDLGFILAPRINSAGRLDDMSLGIECLLTNDEQQAREIATQLNALNEERRAIEKDMQQQVLKDLNELQLNKDLPIGVCLFNKNWHQGVVGILASRIKDRLNRPVIAFAKTAENQIKGSARSVTGVHIRDVLENIANQNPNLISRFGGHAMAAGLNLTLDKYDDFCQAFIKEVGNHLKSDDLCEKIYVDGELANNDFDLETATMLCDAGPWGQSFPEPKFAGIFQIVQQRLVGGKHLKLVLQLPNSTQMVDAVAFNVALDKWPNYRCDNIRTAYRLDINKYRGNQKLQLIIDYLETA